MVTSVRWLFFSLLVFLLFACSLHSKPLHEWGNGIGSAANTSAVNNTEDGTEEISKKEYDTVHGRVLAVNMALMTKKVNESKNRNILESRSQDNENMRMFVQGDMHIDQELYDYIKSGGNSRNAIRARKRLWTSRIIPYHIPSYMNHITSNVQKAIQEFHRKSCLRFVRYHSAYHRNYITFGNSYGCSSRIGKRYAEAGRQTISIGDGCNFVGTIIHEMMHAIGFFHEQARSDRDKYVKIYWENILSGFSDQFDKYPWRTIDDLGVSYDYESVMHYSRRAFTRNGKPTIVAVGNENMEFGTPDDLLSIRDALEINALYDCKTKSHGWTTWSRWTPCDDNCYRRRERFCYNSGNLKSCGGNVNAYGIETQKLKCPSSICPAPIHGHWGRWSEWRPCSKTCNDGTKTRWRRCDNPQPAHGGKQCPGNSTERGMCILKRCHLDFDDADFENRRLGMWTNSQGNKINWQFHKFFTKTVDTGPDRDHTSGQGYYLYMESSSRIGGSRAELVSPWIPVRKSGQCFKFYYAMYGKTMGSLAVKLEISNGKNWYIFYKTGNQGYGWKRGIGNIDLQLGLRYRLKIIGKVGQVGYSDIAIDDVYIDPGLCSCQDDFYTCHLWASKGECSRNENWMKNNCKRSCKVCGVPPSNCVDSDPTQCPSWAANGECKKNPGWMLKHCRKSCKTCGGVSSSCQDANINCPAWAKIGECEKNPRWMLPNCKFSCKQC